MNLDLTSTKTIKQLLSKYDTRPSKRLGQSFLIDKNVLEKIIKTSGLKPDETILEIGPGIGTLTQELAKIAGKVIAIEKDRKMCEILKKTLSDFKNTEIINDDILKIKSFKSISNQFQNPKAKYKIVANIPYYLTSPLIRKFLEEKNKPESMVLMVQKEVAQRICAKPPKMSLLAVSVQFYAEPKIISYVSKNCFWPSPKVDSAIIKITPIALGSPTSQFLGSRTSSNLFFRIVKAGFSQPRKQLVNNLATLKSQNGVKLTKEQTSSWLLKNNLKLQQRAETLSVDDWTNLTKFYKAVL